MPVFGKDPLGTDRVKLLAYMLGDGNMTGGTPRFTNANPAIRQDFAAAVEGFGGLSVRTETSGGTRTPTLCVCSGRASASSTSGGLGRTSPRTKCSRLRTGAWRTLHDRLRRWRRPGCRLRCGRWCLMQRTYCEGSVAQCRRRHCGRRRPRVLFFALVAQGLTELIYHTAVAIRNLGKSQLDIDRSVRTAHPA